MKTPFSPNRLVLLLRAGWALALGGVANGGSFSTNFNSGLLPSGTAVYGNAFVDSTGGAGDNGGVLKLTTATANQLGSFVIDDLDPGQRIGSFVATFNLHMGNGSTHPADGISFNFATDLPNGSFGEEGYGTGLIITFDAFDNSNDNNAEGPEVRVCYGSIGNVIARRKISNQFQTGAGYVPVSIIYTPAGTITLVYNGLVLFTNVYVFGPMGTGARFGFGARTGGAYQEQWIDDLNITTTTTGTPGNGFYVKHPVVPYPPVGISGPNPTFQVSLQDNGYVLDTNSVTMTFNGSKVIPTVSKPAGITTIAYTPPGAVLPSSINHVAVNFSLSGNPTTLLYDLAAASGPLWSLAPNSRTYLPPDPNAGTGGSTPLYRSIAYKPGTQTNHLYVVSRTGATTGLTINVLDANTGDDLYQMNTTGISGGTIILLCIAVADDGWIYAANVSTTALTVYRWANDDPATAPGQVFSGDPGTGVATGKRWGDTLAVTGTGIDTRLILDAQNSQTSAILAPTDINRTAFTATAYSHGYGGTVIGRSLGFVAADTYYLKKRSNSGPPVPAQPLDIIQLGTPPNTTVTTSVSAFYGEVGPVTVDWSRNLAAGIMFVTNAASADHLVVYDVSNIASPLEIAQYDFPTNHQNNANFIGQVVFGGDKIFAVDGNNGIIAVPISTPAAPRLNLAQAGGSVLLSWTNTVPGFNLYSTPVLPPPSWNPVVQPVVENGDINSVTDTLGGGPRFYRLVK